MRAPFALVVTLACAASACSTRSRPPDAPRVATVAPVGLVQLLVADDDLRRAPPSAPRPIVTGDAERQERVLAALFPHHLASSAECPTPFFEPQTWVEVDELQKQNVDAGRFTAVVLREKPGDDDELVVVVRVDNCQSNTFLHFVEATFDRRELEGDGPVHVLRSDEDHPLPSSHDLD